MEDVSDSLRARGANLVRILAMLAIMWGLFQAGYAQVPQQIADPNPEASALHAVSFGTADIARRPAAHFLAGRTLVEGAGAASNLANARAEHAAMVKAQSVEPRISTLNAAWQPVGPAQVASVAYGNISGRISSIAIDPGDRTGNTVYLGTTGGGVWKSSNAAATAKGVAFTPLTDNLPVFSGNAGSSATASLSIGAISVQAGGVVLAGTGDPNDALDSYYGSGILRSADGGLTWTLIQQSDDGAAGTHSFLGLGFSGFAWSTVNPSLVVAGLSQAAEGTIVNASNRHSVMGLYVSSDAGVTWQMATISDGTQTVQAPGTIGISVPGVAATAVVWNPIRQRFYAAIRYHGYYESTDGVSWARLLNQPGTAMSLTACPTNPNNTVTLSCPVFRGALAVQPMTGDTFALTTDRNNLDQGLWQDVCGLSGENCSSGAVNFVNRISSSNLEAGSGSAVIAQADYNLSLAAVAYGADTLLFVGTADLYRCSLSGGCVFRNTTNASNACAAPAKVAPAQHAIAAVNGMPVLYVGNDSGLWRSTDDVNEQGSACSADDASHYQNLNAGIGSLAEVTSLAQDPQDPSNLIVGLGASGTASSSGDPISAWPQVSAGEGGTVAIDQANPLLWYISTAGGVSIRACSSGARCAAADFAGLPTIGAVQTSADASVIDPPWILDPGLSSNVLIGTCRVWRGSAASGGMWSSMNQLSTMLGGPQNSHCDPTTNPFVRSLAAGGPSVSAGTQPNSGSRVLYAGMAGGLDGGGAFAGHVFTTSNADVASSTTTWLDVATSAVTNDVSNSGRFNPGGFDISSLAADPHDATGKTIYATVMGFGGNGISAPHLYGSTDGGGHWLNLSSNLPNAPANSVVVDPNDANTLYVALDTGVYVTSQVTSCPIANCWSVYGVSLPNAPAVQLSAAALMPTIDGRIGMLRAGTYGRGIWQIPLLTAATPAQPSITLNPLGLSFADQAMGMVSAMQTITVTNTGNAPLLVSRTAATGDFVAAGTCSGSSLAVNATCSVQVQFLPSAQGARVGVLTVYANVSGGQATAALSGDGTPPGDILLTPITLTFPATTINAISAVQNITVSNAGGGAVSLQVPKVTGDFQIAASTCSSSLAPSTGCTIAVAFSPSASGTRTGSLVVAGGSGTQTAYLTGTGTTPATDSLSPVALSFALQQLGTTSSAQQVILTNAGDVALTLISAQIRSGDFIAVNGCGNSLNAHSTCAIGVTFSPKSVGAGSGVLVVSDQFRSQTVNLNGVGVAPPGVSLSPAGSMAFPATAVGARSLAQMVTLTNNGGLPLTFQSIGLSGDFAVVPGGTCDAVVAPSATCTFEVAFAPSAGGARSGALVTTDNAPSSPQTLALTGQGIDFTLSADGGTSATVASGNSATYPLLLSSAAGTSGSATLSCTGAPVNSTCMVSPGGAMLGATTLVTVTVATGVTLTARSGEGSPRHTERVATLFCAGMLPFGLVALRRRRVAGLVAMLVLVCFVGVGGCGAGREIPASGDSASGQIGRTPAGNYTLTIAATSSGLTRTMSLALTVQ